MNVYIYSRDRVAELIRRGEFPANAAVISFYSPRRGKRAEEVRVDYSGVCDRVFYISAHDIDIECLDSYGYTYDTYLDTAPDAAAFISSAVRDGAVIICQCDYGQSRSAACAAAILEHYEHRGIDVFADFSYYPNQLVYRKIITALREYEG